MNENINLSHNDMDGAGCNIVLRSKYPDMQTIHSSYNDIAENIELLSENVTHLTKRFFVTDLNFDVPSFIALTRFTITFPHVKVVYIDHHPYEGEVAEIFEKIKKLPNFIHVHEIGKSATKLCYETIQSTDENLGKLVGYINAFDIWLETEDPANFKIGWFLNTIFWEIKLSGFKINLIKNDYVIPKFFKTMYAEQVENKNKYIAKMKANNTLIEDHENSVLIAFSDKYKSWFQNDFPNFVVHILPYQSKNNLSVRIQNNPEVTWAKEMKQEMVEFIQSYPNTISCGGHDHAFGAAISNDAPKEDIFSLVEGLSDIAGEYLRKNTGV